MTNPGSLGGFPGNWSFQGDAKFVVGDYSQKISVSLNLTFIEGTEIDVKLIWEGVSDKERLDFSVKMRKFRHQILIVQRSIILIGFSIPPTHANNGVTSFNAARLITYSSFPNDTDPCKSSSYFVQLRAYLNDDYSSMDDILASEFENTPQRINRTAGAKERYKMLEENLSLYCALNSGYEVKCGKKYITHKDHNVFHRKNIETLYRLSFLDVSVPLNVSSINFFKDEENHSETYLLQHLEHSIGDACAFLSIVCDYEILPIYYDYSIYSQKRYVCGRVIPICNRRGLSRISKSWPTQGISLFHNVASFFECCPMDEKLSRGIKHLKPTVHDIPIELKLMAACSAIEYFYSYWFWEMHGLSKLIGAIQEKNILIFLKNKNNRDVENLSRLRHGKGCKTPYLSTVIRFFLDDLGIDWNKYIDDAHTPHFIQVRNELLHGSFIANDTVLCLAEDSAQKIGTEILFRIMKLISRSNVSESYEDLPMRSPEQDFYIISEGWADIKNAFDELSSNSDTKIFWT